MLTRQSLNGIEEDEELALTPLKILARHANSSASASASASGSASCDTGALSSPENSAQLDGNLLRSSGRAELDGNLLRVDSESHSLGLGCDSTTQCFDSTQHNDRENSQRSHVMTSMKYLGLGDHPFGQNISPSKKQLRRTVPFDLSAARWRCALWGKREVSLASPMI